MLTSLWVRWFDAFSYKTYHSTQQWVTLAPQSALPCPDYFERTGRIEDARQMALPLSQW